MDGISLSAIFDEDERYSLSDLKEIFNVSSSQTIRNWIDKDHLECRWTSRNGQKVREFVGHEIMRDINRSEFLQKRLRQAHKAKLDQTDLEYVKGLEDTIGDLKEELDRVKEEREQLREEKEKQSDKILDVLQGMTQEMEALREEQQEMKDQLPPSDESNESRGSSTWSWFRNILPAGS